MRKSTEQKSRRVEIPQHLKKYWWRFLVIIGMVGVGSAPILFADSASQTGEINGARTHVPQPSPAAEASEHNLGAVSTPPARSGFQNQEQFLIEPSPIPEPLPRATGTPRP